ncbi:MAG: cupin domain-containing protein [Deltaproteobacteria bacterium]|nr:cupin domain-containing protein [Deltaproteobacteria bacterium]
MKHIQAREADSVFQVVGETARSQAATMVLQPGSSTGGADNRHADADQWLVVISGAGKAIIEGFEVSLTAGSLLLIEAGETHEIVNTGANPLATINFYAPPEY